MLVRGVKRVDIAILPRDCLHAVNSSALRSVVQTFIVGKLYAVNISRITMFMTEGDPCRECGNDIDVHRCDKCTQCYHILCLEIEEEDNNDGARWICPHCKALPQRTDRTTRAKAPPTEIRTTKRHKIATLPQRTDGQTKQLGGSHKFPTANIQQRGARKQARTRFPDSSDSSRRYKNGRRDRNGTGRDRINSPEPEATTMPSGNMRQHSKRLVNSESRQPRTRIQGRGHDTMSGPDPISLVVKKASSVTGSASSPTYTSNNPVHTSFSVPIDGVTATVIIPPGVDDEEKSKLQQWASLVYNTELKAPHPDLRKWIFPELRFASIQTTSGPQARVDPAAEKCDVLALSSEEFMRLASKGELFDKPLLIREGFRDANDFSNRTYADRIEQTFIDVSINVRYNNSELDTMSPLEAARIIRQPPNAVSPKLENFLDLDNLSDAILPEFTRLSRFKVLDRLVRGVKAKHSGQSGKRTFLTPFDVGNCRTFDILGVRGAFSGAHVDALNGTWLRNLFGIKLWMIVPQALMTEQDWEEFGRDGPTWNPGPKSRALILRPGDVFFMPPGLLVVHAVFTLETSLMAGGMLWDELAMVSVLHNIYWIGKNQKATNEALPYQLSAVLDRLKSDERLNPSLYKDTRELQQAIRALQRLGCKCATCNGECPCSRQDRRCTPLCTGHSMESKMDCLEEPTAGSSDGGSVTSDGDSTYEPLK